MSGNFEKGGKGINEGFALLIRLQNMKIIQPLMVNGDTSSEDGVKAENNTVKNVLT